ncbi:uncharacterized protein BX664DRAFT_332637 [Halteromyces radiatus]|uniref:uncharacterized protein n=1 Tax=Halteromyces radiatus TaxID=101107 RepID=UPI00221FA998|nr:uncharacterized protein BX664DRAFT_332637 [Halteromyces radiatus]KAI8089288.1 hypothetical protein BX664DRAFT_332637 [Halteromyces radiatus]
METTNLKMHREKGCILVQNEQIHSKHMAKVQPMLRVIFKGRTKNTNIRRKYTKVKTNSAKLPQKPLVLLCRTNMKNLECMHGESSLRLVSTSSQSTVKALSIPLSKTTKDQQPHTSVYPVSINPLSTSKKKGINMLSNNSNSQQCQRQLYATKQQQHPLTAIDPNRSSIFKTNDEKEKDQISSSMKSDFAYVDIIRKKEERSKLHGVTCSCCIKYFESMKKTEEMIQCYSRHRERYKTPSTPPDFWNLDFPPSP